MARKKKRKAEFAPFKPYENGPFPESNHYLRLTHTLLRHEKFLKLSSSAKVLYVFMRDWSGKNELFKYSASMSLDYMTKPTYYKARDELCKAGFIIWLNKPRASKNNRYDGYETAEFEFSDRWFTGEYKSEPPESEVKEFLGEE